MDEARTNGAVVEWGCTHLFLYRGVGRSYFLDAATREEAEAQAAKLTHIWWDDYLTAPCYIEYIIMNLRSGEEYQYREGCGPKQEPEPECTDANGHKWETLYSEDDHEGDHCPKCGRYRRYYIADPKRGLPEFSEYLDSL